MSNQLWIPNPNKLPADLEGTLAIGKSAAGRAIRDGAGVHLVEENVTECPDLATFYAALAKSDKILESIGFSIDYRVVQAELELVMQKVVLGWDVQLPKKGLEMPKDVIDGINAFQEYAFIARPRDHIRAYEAARELFVKDRSILGDIAFHVIAWVQNRITTDNMLYLVGRAIEEHDKLGHMGIASKTVLWLDSNPRVAYQRNVDRPRDTDNWLPEEYITLIYMAYKTVVLPLMRRKGIEVFEYDWSVPKSIVQEPGKKESWKLAVPPSEILPDIAYSKQLLYTRS